VQPDNVLREQLVAICGSQFATGPACCTSDQVTSLSDNIKQAEAFIASCPACKNNFLSFFCTFTCSPDQGSFTNITSTQTTSEGTEAVKSLDFFVSEPYASGFFDSCKEVKFGASNGYAMDFIGGGAKDYHGFLKFLGDEKAVGSPFQIDYPSSTPPEFTPLSLSPRSCSDPELSSRCACMDCPQTCPVLPPQPDPYSSPTCHVGLTSCLTFALLLMYGLAIFAFFTGFIAQTAWRKRKERSYERVALSTDAASLNNQQPSPSSHTRPLVGASSLALYFDNDSGPPPETPRHHLGRGASLLDPIETLQPPQYKLNKILRRTFYRIGHFCASWPWLTFFFVFLAIGLLNMGWKKFAVETDPVRLWVAPNSESKLQKDFFDRNFGPFFRAEGGIFVTSPTRPTSIQNSSIIAEDLGLVLSWERLKWWEKVESDIYALQTEDGVTLDDVCFKPSGPDGACVVQSILGWFNGLENWDDHTWKEQLLNCADNPSQVECLPPFQQPLIPEMVLGGVENNNWLSAKAIITTFVVSNSLDPDVVGRAESWERVLRQYLSDLANDAPGQSGSQVFFSTGVSLEEELNKSTNTDVRIIVLSYLLMFFYVSLTLGSNAAGADEETLVGSLVTWLIGLPSLFRQKNVTASPVVNANPTPRATWYPRLPRRLFMGSKFTLGLFGIALVILSVTASVGLFSFLGVKVTLIIAEVIPFLVLAVGVDNVFILVHELDRQNAQHGPNAKGIPDPTSPQSSHDSVGADSVPLHLHPEERVARSLAKMGPSILLSSLTETVAFALGALVPMPAVRNFALYAAGSVFLNALMQVTVFVSALSLDLRRVEVRTLEGAVFIPCMLINLRPAAWIASRASVYPLESLWATPLLQAAALPDSLNVPMPLSSFKSMSKASSS
jgi:Niemann-Pick C1 protein